MSGSVNKVILVGNLGRDPDSRTMQNGGTVVTLSLATSERWKDRYSTEVVLAQFRGELTMLDSQGGGNTPPPASGPGDYGHAKSTLAPSGGEGRGEGAARQTDYPADLDDEIPF